ncbi:hypothetical protein ACHAXS_001194 [Conticribra weissflogii]
MRNEEKLTTMKEKKPICEGFKDLRQFGGANFATTAYGDVESSGPPSSPLGFPAPRVDRARITSILCIDKKARIVCQENAILSESSAGGKNDAYMLTSYILKRTICGKIVKGFVLKRPNASSLKAVAKGHLGEGSLDSVWEKSDDVVAIKIDYRQVMERLHSEHHFERNPEYPWKEIAAMQLLGNNHPNVVGLIGAFMDEKCLYEVLEYCSQGSLSTFMATHPTGVPEPQARRFFNDILSGLAYLHSRGVCHHDLSTDNVLLDDLDMRAVIIDFGMCLRVPHSYPDDPSGTTDDVTDVSMGTRRRLIHSQNHCGKLRFMAPEIYNREDHFDGLSSDIWSLGINLFVLLTGRQPYEKPDKSDPGFYDLINPKFYWDTVNVNPCFSWGFEISDAAVELLRKMLSVDLSERASLSWVLNHKWVNDTSPIDKAQ